MTTLPATSLPLTQATEAARSASADASAPVAAPPAIDVTAGAAGTEASGTQHHVPTEPQETVDAQAQAAHPQPRSQMGQLADAKLAALQQVQATQVPSASPVPTSAGSIGGVIFALLLIVALIVLLGRFARRMPGVRGSSHPQLDVVATLALSPREQVVLVQVGPEQLLLGVGAAGIQRLHELPLPLQAHTPPPAASHWSRLLGKRTDAVR